MNLEFAALQPKITKDFILSHVNQETIFNHYLKVNPLSKKLQLNPLRTDHKVTVSFYKSKSGVLYMHDFATNEHINCFEAIMRLYNIDFYQSLKKIAVDFGFIKGNSSYVEHKINYVKDIVENKPCNIRCQIKDFTEEEYKWWEKYGVTKQILKQYHVYSIAHVFLNGNLSFSSTSKNLIFGYYFGKDKNGNEKWKIYFPYNKNKGIRFLNNLESKKLQGYKQLPKESKVLVITKSLKDCMSFKSFGISAVAPASESTFCTDKQIEEFKKRFKYIIVMYDQDRAGKYNMAKIRHKYPELIYFVIPKELDSKDFSDLRKKFGKDKTKDFVLRYFKWLKL